MATVRIERIDNPPPPEELLKIFERYPYAFFLDSAMASERLGRFSFLGCDPFLVFKSKKDSVILDWQGGRTESFRRDPFIALEELLAKYKTEKTGSPIPLTSGAVGYFSYDLKGFVEDLPDTSRDDLGLADCILGFYDCLVAYDNLTGHAYIASSGLPHSPGVKRERRRSDRMGEFKDIVKNGDRYPVFNGAAAENRVSVPNSNFSKSDYMATITRAKEYIRKGDIYQVNLSQRFEASPGAEALAIYLKLREVSPAPFASYLDFQDVKILSSSPERFLMKKSNYIETRPIKGTRPRGGDEKSDIFLERELKKSPKDNAEHIMIVDLERNDLGRICDYGSVRVTENAIVEKYANVFHLVSTVSGRLKEGVGPVEVLRAAFPGGSITGAPKIRSMEIIEELEPVKRSVYTGAIGYISFDGDMDTSIVIRTLVIKGSKAYFSVGGGIVADSDPELEYQETLDKAKGLMQALGLSNADNISRAHFPAICSARGGIPPRDISGRGSVPYCCGRG